MIRKVSLPILLLVAGCATLVIDPVEQLRDTNKRNIAQLSIGMSRFQVEKLMGDARAGGKLGDVAFGRVRHLEARNPMREERVTGPDGTVYDVLFYYTDLRQRDDKITDDELTPLVFRRGELSGIGYGYLGKLAPKYSGVLQ